MLTFHFNMHHMFILVDIYKRVFILLQNVFHGLIGCTTKWYVALMGEVSYELYVSYTCWWLNWSWIYLLLSRCCDLNAYAQIFALPKFRLKSVWQILNRSEHFVADSLASSCKRTTGWGRRWSHQYIFLGNISFEILENVFFQNIQMASSSKTRLTDWRKTSAWPRRRSPWTRSTLGKGCWSWWTGGASFCWWWQGSCIMTEISIWWGWWSSR